MQFAPVISGLLILFFASSPLAAREIIDSAGRKVTLPDRIERIFAAGPPAAVVVAVLAPEKLLGWPTRLREGSKPYLPARLRDLSELGRLTGRGDTANLEVVIRARPDLVVDFGTVAPTYVSLADRVQTQTGIPVVLIDGRFGVTAASIRHLGKILGVEERAEAIARYAEETFSLVDRVLVVTDGRVAAEGKPAEILTAARLSATYNIKVEVETTSSGARVARPVLDSKARPNP